MPGTSAGVAAAERLRLPFKEERTTPRLESSPAWLAVTARSDAILTLSHISLAFGGVAALTDVSLSVRRGEICSVIGPNGAGKSSLINVVSGLYKPDHGSIRLDGQMFGQMRPDRLAHLGVARTFQNLALFGGLSVPDNVSAGLTHTRRAGVLEQAFFLPRSRREDREIGERVDAMLSFLDLGPFRDRLVSTLPYGLQKRVELARALVAEPKLLLLDEPMAGMTATEKQEMAAFVRSARQRYGITIILIEHDIGIVMALSDHVAVLDYGRKISDGTPDEVRSDPAVIRAYIGSTEDEDLV
ncbi:ABC transporter ATP-binding protein [Microvirga calopogonii]|uniref:ABC transporter ATP-binding protein n=1 Tax=Microvirga calopogonii TaxID=2078013 RepID=UPI000E0D15F5|nr:ABC transporter ATP-binding protein [Microvirga calopogonii]